MQLHPARKYAQSLLPLGIKIPLVLETCFSFTINIAMSGGKVTLTDLNDYIKPSVACTKPLPKPSPRRKPIEVSKEDDGMDIDNGPLEIAKITLNDCLACR